MLKGKGARTLPVISVALCAVLLTGVLFGSACTNTAARFALGLSLAPAAAGTDAAALPISLSLPALTFTAAPAGAAGTDEFFYPAAGGIADTDPYIAPDRLDEPDAADILAALLADETFEPYAGENSVAAGAIIALDMHPNDRTKYITWSQTFIKNKSVQTFDVSDLMRVKPDLHLEPADQGPQVLIYHSHTSESYNTSGDLWYPDSPTHSADNALNVVAVGDILARTLSATGINVVHCTQRQDEVYTDSYRRSYDTVTRYLEAYPTLRIVIDLHRDAVSDASGAQYRPVAQVDGLQTAQIMIIVGAGDGAHAANEHWQDNLRFGITLNDMIEQMYPGMTRALTVRTSHFNQQLSPGALLIEFGCVGNTLTEAQRAAYFTATALARIIKEN